MFIMASQISTGALKNSVHCIKIETVLKYLSVVSGHWQKPGNRIAKIQEHPKIQVICFDDDDDNNNDNNKKKMMMIMVINSGLMSSGEQSYFMG